jgi:MFS transporter, DHA1 family, multidrug resistance protein
MSDSNKRHLYVLCLIVLISGIGYGIISPIIPVYAEELEATSVEIGVMVASFAVFQVAFQAPGGLLSDRIGPKRIIFSGLVLISFSSFLFTLTEDIYLFMVFRAIEGSGTGMIFPSVSAYVFSISSSENRGSYMGTFLTFWILGFTMGPAIGGVLADQYGILTPFYFCSGISLLAIILMELILVNPEGSKENDNEYIPFVDRVRSIVRKPGMPAVLFRGFTIQFNNGVHMMALALFLYEIVGLTKTLIGFVFAFEGLFMLVATPIGGRLTDRIGRKKPIIFGGMGMAFTWYMMPLVENVHENFGPFVLDEFGATCLLVIITGIGVGLNSPAAMSLITETSPGKQKGTGMGVYGTISGTGFIAGPVLAGYLYGLDHTYPFRMGAGMALLSITFVYFFVQETGVGKGAGNRDDGSRIGNEEKN